MIKHIETMTGHGRITKEDGSLIGVRPYHVTVWQREHDDGRGGTIPGLFSIDGHIELEGHEGFLLVSAGDSLTLELQDGRKLPFFFADSNGRIAARGALSRP